MVVLGGTEMTGKAQHPRVCASLCLPSTGFVHTAGQLGAPQGLTMNYGWKPEVRPSACQNCALVPARVRLGNGGELAVLSRSLVQIRKVTVLDSEGKHVCTPACALWVCARLCARWKALKAGTGPAEGGTHPLSCGMGLRRPGQALWGPGRTAGAVALSRVLAEE